MPSTIVIFLIKLGSFNHLINAITSTSSMNKPLTFLFLLFVIISCNSKKTTDDMITTNGVGKIKLGESISELKQKVPDNFTVEAHGKSKFGFDITENGDVLIKIYSGSNEKIELIEIYSEKFHTENRVKVGITIEELEKIYPDFAPEMDSHNGRVFFKPKELQTSSTQLTLFFAMKDDSIVWKFIKTPNDDWYDFTPNGDINKKAVIESIVIESKQ